MQLSCFPLANRAKLGHQSGTRIVAGSVPRPGTAAGCSLDMAFESVRRNRLRFGVRILSASSNDVRSKIANIGLGTDRPTVHLQNCFDDSDRCSFKILEPFASLSIVLTNRDRNRVPFNGSRPSPLPPKFFTSPSAITLPSSR